MLWQVRRLQEQGTDELPLADLCASFQRAVTEALIAKVGLAVRMTGIRTVTASGGVAANTALREALMHPKEARRWRAFVPRPARCTDNAVMIAMAGRDAWERGERSPAVLSPDPSLTLGRTSAASSAP